MDKRFRGLGVALITPFRPNGAIDHAALAKVIEHQITGGIDYLVVMGTTGESATLSLAEKKQLLAQVIEVVHNRVPIVFGIGGNNTAEGFSALFKNTTGHSNIALALAPVLISPQAVTISTSAMKVLLANPTTSVLAGCKLTRTHLSPASVEQPLRTV